MRLFWKNLADQPIGPIIWKIAKRFNGIQITAYPLDAELFKKDLKRTISPLMLDFFDSNNHIQ